MAMEQAQKALDTLVGANYLREDLSELIMLTYDPERPLQALLASHTKASNTTHQWNDVALTAPTGSSASYNEGNKPYSTNYTPNRRSNTTARFGRVARVTDEQAAAWTGGGAYSLADGEMVRLFAESLELDSELQMRALLNEVEYVLVNGVSANNSSTLGAEVSQFDGIDLGVKTGKTPGIGGPGQTINESSAALTLTMISTLALDIRNQRGPWAPSELIVSVHDKNIVNGFQSNVRVNGGTTTDFSGMHAGTEVEYINTGYSAVRVVVSDWLPSGRAYLVNMAKNFRFADLIPLGSEPLAKINTTVERLINYVTTLECNALGSTTGCLYGLSTS